MSAHCFFCANPAVWTLGRLVPYREETFAHQFDGRHRRHWDACGNHLTTAMHRATRKGHDVIVKPTHPT